MSKQSYYVVQTSSDIDIAKCGPLTFAEARRVFRELRKEIVEKGGGFVGRGRRFPRIIKVTVETKTVTANN